MPSKKGINQLRFGGWYSYREWAEHGFTPRSEHDQSTEPEAKPEPEAQPAADRGTVPSAGSQGSGDVGRGAFAPDLYPVSPETDRPDKPLIRPYVLTGGRTRPRHELALHTLILTTDVGRTKTGRLLSEHEAICGLCATARSVAEIAATLRVPLGTARVIIDDMECEGLIEVVASVYDGGRSVEILTRVLEGLRRL